jgi:hypothetical protein
MKLISHRGNIDGRFESYENEPNYIDKAISDGYDVEVDVWVIAEQIYLGHDTPQYGVPFRWFRDRISKLWIHCKNVEAIQLFKSVGYEFNFFWHQTDVLTLTSTGYVWVYPGNQPIENSIAVMPELFNDNISKCCGVCSDYIVKYKK